MTITVRRATEADAEQVSVLNRNVQQIHAAAMPTRFKPPGPGSFPKAEFAAVMAKAENLVFLAFVDEVNWSTAW
jgi:hypothetical protein